MGNALIVYGLVLLYDGIQLFFGRRAFDRWNNILVGVYLLLQLYLIYIKPDINERILLVSTLSFILEFRIGASLFLHGPPELRQICKTLALIFLFSALISMVSGSYALFQPLPVDIYSDRTLLALSFANICSITVWTFYCFFLNSTLTELDLLTVTGWDQKPGSGRFSVPI